MFNSSFFFMFQFHIDRVFFSSLFHISVLTKIFLTIFSFTIRRVFDDVFNSFSLILLCFQQIDHSMAKTKHSYWPILITRLFQALSPVTPKSTCCCFGGKGVGNPSGLWRSSIKKLGWGKRMAIDYRNCAGPPVELNQKRSTDSIKIRQEYLALP